MSPRHSQEEAPAGHPHHGTPRQAAGGSASGQAPSLGPSPRHTGNHGHAGVCEDAHRSGQHSAGRSLAAGRRADGPWEPNNGGGHCSPPAAERAALPPLFMTRGGPHSLYFGLSLRKNYARYPVPRGNSAAQPVTFKKKPVRFFTPLGKAAVQAPRRTTERPPPNTGVLPHGGGPQTRPTTAACHSTSRCPKLASHSRRR